MMKCDEVIKELAAPTDQRNSAALAGHLAGCAACASWANRAVQLDRLWEATRPPGPTPDVWDGVWAHIATSLEASTQPVGEIPLKKAVHSSRSRPWRMATIGLLGLAQAAAILLAVGLTWYRSSPSQTTEMPGTANLISFHPESGVHIAIPEEGFPVVIDEGHLVVIHEKRQDHKLEIPVFLADLSVVVIHADGKGPKVVDQSPRRVLAQVQWWKKTPKVKKVPKVTDQGVEGGPLFGVDDWYVMYNEVESMASPVVAMQE